MKRIYVHRNATKESDFERSFGLLKALGYDVSVYSEFWNLPFDDDVWVIDARAPTWRSWRDVMSCIEWRHYDQICELNRAKELDLTPPPVVQSEDDECTH